MLRSYGYFTLNATLGALAFEASSLLLSKVKANKPVTAAPGSIFTSLLNSSLVTVKLKPPCGAAIVVTVSNT